MTQDQNTRNIKDEIEELLDIPDIAAYFSEILIKVKQTFKEQIDQYGHLRKFKKIHKKDTAEFAKAWPEGKTYFFDLSGVADQHGVRWEPVKVKSTEDRYIIDMVIAKFCTKISKYEVNSDLIQSENIELPELEKTFKIGFTKKSEIHVIGFIKELEEKKAPENFVLRDDTDVFIITKKYKNLEKEEMYTQIKQRMEEYPELIEDIYFYSHMVLKPVGRPRGSLKSAR